MPAMLTLGLRIKQLRLAKDMTKSALGAIVGLSGQGIADIEEGKTLDPRYQALMKIAKHFQVDLTWLLTGEEPVLKSNKVEQSQLQIVRDSRKGNMPAVISVDPEGNENIHYVNVRARAGYLMGYADPEYIGTLPAYRLPGFNNGTYRMFEVEGKSMHSTLNPKDVVIAQWVESWQEIRDERVYVLVTDEGIVVKRALNRVDQYGIIIGKSDNINKHEYPHLDIDPRIIREVWYARAYMSNYFTPPSDLYNRVSNNEADISFIMSQLKIKGIL